MDGYAAQENGLAVKQDVFTAGFNGPETDPVIDAISVNGKRDFCKNAP